MRFHVWSVGFASRVIAILASVTAALAVTAPSAPAAEFGVQKFLAGTCKVSTCSETSVLSELFTQAAAHPNFGITDFRFNALNPGEPGKEIPAGFVKNIRIDLPSGLSVNPEALPLCSQAEFAAIEVHPGIFTESACEPSTVIGEDQVTVVVEPAPGVFVDVPLKGKAYNLEQPIGVSAEVGVAISLEPLGAGFAGLFSHTVLEGGVSWHKEIGIDKEVVPMSGDYHELFKINNVSRELPLLESRLITEGQAGAGYLTTPSVCNVRQRTGLEVESYEGVVQATSFTTPIGATGCEEVPFKPTAEVASESTRSDAPNGATIVLKVPQNEDKEAIDSSTLQAAEVTLPEGMTLNPAAAAGLEACTDEQFGKGTERAVECPAGSRIGTVAIQTPTLPKGSLTGNVYVGKPLNSNPGSGEDYRIFIDAESARYGVSVRLIGKVIANESTGRLTTIIAENPQSPFSEFILTLSNGNHTPLANPLSCGTATTSTVLSPYTGEAAANPFAAFTVDFDGKGGACPATLPFSLKQSTKALPATGGSSTSFTLGLERAQGQQYLSKLSTTLPAGMVAKIPSVPRCGEPLARDGRCPAVSEIGTVSASIGSGPAPYVLPGTVFLTGPFAGAPFGLSIVVPAEHIGPYDYGRIVTQAAINIDPHTARVSVSGTLPTIVGGVPLRLKALTVAITHANFMLNPTSCGVLSTDTTLTSTFGATDSISTPFQASGCGSLRFAPRFSASSNAHTTRRFGASLKVIVKMPAGDANIKSVAVTLPQKLPSRLATLKLACSEKVFAANPGSCPQGSRVGGASASTPALPGKLTGTAYFVSHGGAAFPDLDVVLKGDGVTVILVGRNNISKKITHTTFAALPDVPISSFELNLPTGAHSALTANGSLCKHKLFMPTTIVAQSGRKITQRTLIHVRECPVRIVGHVVRGSRASIVAAVSSAGRLSTSGRDLRLVHRRVRKAVGNAKIAVRLSPLGEALLARHHRLTVRVRVGFRPSTGAKRESQAFVKLVFRS